MKNLISTVLAIGSFLIISSFIAFARTYPGIALAIFIVIVSIILLWYIVIALSNNRNKNASSEKEFAKLRKELRIEEVQSEPIKETIKQTSKSEKNTEKKEPMPQKRKTIPTVIDSQNMSIIERASRDLDIPLYELKEYDRIFEKYKLDFEIHGNAAKFSEQPRNMWNYNCYINYLTEQTVNENINRIYNYGDYLDANESEQIKKHEEIQKREKQERAKKIQIEKKHVIISLLLDPSTCHFEAKDIVNEGETPFGFLNRGLRLRSKEDIIYGSIFVWILKQTEDREGFLNMMEILDKNNFNLWRYCMTYPAIEIIEEIKRYFPEFKLANDPEDAKASLQWALLDTYALNRFIVVAYEFILENFNKDICTTTLSGCTSLDDLYILALNDIKEGDYLSLNIYK